MPTNSLFQLVSFNPLATILICVKWVKIIFMLAARGNSCQLCRSRPVAKILLQNHIIVRTVRGLWRSPSAVPCYSRFPTASGTCRCPWGFWVAPESFKIFVNLPLYRGAVSEVFQIQGDETRGPELNRVLPVQAWGSAFHPCGTCRALRATEEWQWKQWEVGRQEEKLAAGRGCCGVPGLPP